MTKHTLQVSNTQVLLLRAAITRFQNNLVLSADRRKTEEEEQFYKEAKDDTLDLINQLGVINV